MSRREEVDGSIETILDSPHYDNYEDMWHAVLPITRTLADEVDALRKENERIKQNHGCARHQNTTQFCVEVAGRDAVITKLLVMLEPKGNEPKRSHFSPTQFNAGLYAELHGNWQSRKALHARACEIAGRKSNACKRCAGTGITERLVSPRYRQNEVCGTCNGTGRKE